MPDARHFKSMSWAELEAAAAAGDLEAQFALANKFIQRFATAKREPRDAENAARWYREAAERGHPGSQYRLGLAYAKGEGVVKDPGEAVRWYRKAAEQANAWAQFRLGVCLKLGEGTPPDLSEAQKWLGKAAEQNHEEAQSALRGLLARVSEAEEEARDTHSDTSNEISPELEALLEDELKESLQAAEYEITESAEDDLVVTEIQESQTAPFPTLPIQDAGCEVPAAQTQVALPSPEPTGKVVRDQTSKQNTQREWDDDRVWLAAPLGELRPAAEGGVAAAQCELGRRVEQDGILGRAPDPEAAARWYRRAADQGYAEAQRRLGEMYFHGRGVAQDDVEAERWLSKAGQQGAIGVQFALEVLRSKIAKKQQDTDTPKHRADSPLNTVRSPLPQESQATVARSPQAAPGHPPAPENRYEVRKEWSNDRQWVTVPLDELREAAQSGVGGAQCELGQRLETTGLYGRAPDHSGAAGWYRRAAEQGYAEAQRRLGEMYFHGRGVAKDEAEAVKWYRKAAEQNDGEAQYALGFCHANGRGVRKNEAEAVKWYRKAAGQNNAQAEYALGFCYFLGRGVVKDVAEAVRWYRKAADQNHAKAQNNLGFCYANGQGVAMDEAEAVKWYRKAADQNDAQAQYSLGFRYANGQGVAMDKAEAVKWFRKAGEQEDAARTHNLLPACAPSSDEQATTPLVPLQPIPRHKRLGATPDAPRASSCADVKAELSFFERPVVRWVVFITCVVAFGAWVSASRKAAAERKQRTMWDVARWERMHKQGYREQLDGRYRLGTREELWADGSRCDYKYYGTEGATQFEIFAMKDEQKVYGKYEGYDKDLLFGEFSVEGFWVDNGKVRVWDSEGKQHEVRITGRH